MYKIRLIYSKSLSWCKKSKSVSYLLERITMQRLMISHLLRTYIPRNVSRCWNPSHPIPPSGHDSAKMVQVRFPNEPSEQTNNARDKL